MYDIVNKDTLEVLRTTDKPVNTDLSVNEWTQIDKETGEVVLRTVQVVRVIDDTLPVYDEATQKIVQVSEINLEAKERLFAYQVEDKTAEEQEAYQAQQKRIADFEQARIDLAEPAKTIEEEVAKLRVIVLHLIGGPLE